MRLYQDYREVVEASAAAWFKRHGRVVDSRRPYILASKKDWDPNLIDDRIYPLVEPVRPRHTYIHHGLSSQALCFNLFGSLLVHRSLSALAEPFSQAGVPWPSGLTEGQFEYDDVEVFHESHKEQPTSWDFALTQDGKARVLIEVKFTEQSVGACSVFTRGDCDGDNPKDDFQSCFLEREKHRRYWEVFRDFGLLDTAPFGGAICPMTIYYQFYREVAFAAARNAHMVYLFDDRNPVFSQQVGVRKRGLLPHLLGNLPRELAGRVTVISIAALVRQLSASGEHKEWIGEFAAKYGLAGAAS